VPIPDMINNAPLARRIGDSAITAPVLNEVADVKSGNKRFQAASVAGSTPNIQMIRSIHLSMGRFFTESESRRFLRLAVIGQDVVREIFPSSDPLDKNIRIKGRSFRVIGVQEKQGSSFGSSLDRMVCIPLPALSGMTRTFNCARFCLQPVRVRCRVLE
jgi:putative ABC transport system permease protein